MKLSIVATLYRSEPYLAAFHERVTEAANALVGGDYEIVLVNDGSPDASLDRAVELAGRDRHVVVVDLSRNFGHHKAMMTGLAHSRGDLVFLIDSDLEEDPEWLGLFAKRMHDSGSDVVFGQQQRRKGGMFERLSGDVFYSFFRMLTGLRLPPNVTTARLLSRQYVDSLLLHKEREVFLAGIWHITGFSQCAVPVVKRSSSATTYSFFAKVYLLVNSVTSFSSAPLVGIFYVGAIVSTVSGGFAAFLVFNWLFLERPVSGWTSVMASLWLIGGLLMSFLGILGIYLSKVFVESKQRPYTIVRKVHRHHEP